ncbi:MAG: VWA domain-containing protein, partial [Burkholderiaceae bacterium]|nr:VWA domain-containing protein [Burkholderiaceae bacterium]
MFVTPIENRHLQPGPIFAGQAAEAMPQGRNATKEYPMSHFSRTVARLCAGLAIVASLGVAAPVKASVIQLGFIIDESGSIGSGNYTIIKNGLASAINTLIPVDGTYEISVVSFASSAQTLVNHVLIDSAAALTSVVNAITGDGYSGGSTYMGAAFNAMTTALSGSTRAISASYVNFATDGVNSDADATVIAARNALIAAGADNISVEGIGSGIDQNFLKNSICFPGPCDDSAPYNFPTQGFYIGVADAAGYAAAIGNKIRIVTGQVPEPQMIALL